MCIEEFTLLRLPNLTRTLRFGPSATPGRDEDEGSINRFDLGFAPAIARAYYSCCCRLR